MTGDLKPFDAVKFAAGVRDLVERAVRPLTERIAALEARETKSLADAYRGTWQPNGQYAKGQLATHNGSLWIALSDTSDKPGTGSGAWRLCVKGQA